MTNPSLLSLEVMCFIVPYGMARKIVKVARNHDVMGATIFLGKGTIQHKQKWRDILELSEIRREIVFMIVDEALADRAMEPLNDKFKFHKPHHGIVFRMPVTQIIGSSCYANRKNQDKGDELYMYQAIFVVVEKGLAEEVILAAESAGSKGGTIINARGAGIHETSKVFNIEIEPEKEVVLILSEAASTEKITDSIRSQINIDEPGKGIIFIQDVKKTYGLSKE